MKTFKIVVDQAINAIEVLAANFRVDESGNVVFVDTIDESVAAFSRGNWKSILPIEYPSEGKIPTGFSNC